MRIAIIGKLYAPITVTSNMGMETFTYNLVRILVKRGHEVTLFASGDSRVEGTKVITLVKKSFCGATQKLPVEKKNMGTGLVLGSGEKRGYLKALFYLRSHKNDFDIIHDNTDELEIIGPASILINLPVAESHIHIVLSLLPEAIYLSSGLKATTITSFVCPCR